MLGEEGDKLLYKLKNGLFYTPFAEFLPNHDETLEQKKFKLRM